MSKNPKEALPFTLPVFEKKSSLSSKAVEELRAAIITGLMQPGEVYTVPRLAAMLGISATPVREAMLSLAKEGLMEAQRNVGFRVVELTDDELDEITEIRLLLEVPAIEKLTSMCDAELADKIEKDFRHVAQDLVKYAHKGDLISFIEVDRHFHLGILGLLGNTRLVNLAGELRAQSRLYGLRHLADIGDLEQSAQEHELLLNYITSGNVTQAVDLMLRHIMHVRRIWAGNEEPVNFEARSTLSLLEGQMKPLSAMSKTMFEKSDLGLTRLRKQS